MKKIALISLFLGVCTSGFAQFPDLRFGPSFGMGSSGFVSNPAFIQQNKLAFDAGLNATEQFNRFVGLEADFLFSKRGALVYGTTQDGQDLFGTPRYYSYVDNYDLNYAQIPLLAKLSLGFANFRIKAFAGPAVNILLYGTQERTYDDQNYGSGHNFDEMLHVMNTTNYSAVYGLGIEAGNSVNTIYFLDFRMNTGITPFGRINDRDVFNNAFTIQAGCLFK